MSKKFVLSTVILLAAVLGLVAFTATPASAFKQFKDAFKSKYVKPNSTAPNDVALAKAFKTAGCMVCHVGESRKNRNAYGQQLAKLLTKADKKNLPKIYAAMDKVGKMKSSTTDPKAPTFGEKIAHGKLPAEN